MTEEKKGYTLPQMKRLPEDLSIIPAPAMRSMHDALAGLCVRYVDEDRIEEAKLAASEIKRLETFMLEQSENCDCSDCQAQVSSSNATEGPGIRLATKDGNTLH
jgi:hypothetical protein